MAQVRSWAGLDVHARSVLAVTVDSESGEMRTRRLPGATSEVVAFCASLPGPTKVAYEAGPTGYGLARALHAAGIGCIVAAPGKIERPAQDRVKTDQRDGERVLRLLMIDGLHAVRVPSCEERRCATSSAEGRLARRSDARAPTPQQAAAAPRRHLRGHRERVDGTPPRVADEARLGRRCAVDAAGLPARDRRDGDPPRRAADGDRRARARLAVGATGRQAALPARDRHAVSRRAVRRGRRLRALQQGGPADELPRPRTVGEQQRRNAPPGRDHEDRLTARPPTARRVGLALPQAAARGKALERRQDGQPAHVLAIAWQAQQRLHRVWRRLDGERGKRRTIVAVAVARELAGFCWALARAD